VDLILPEIISGGSLESLFYSYVTETPIVLTQPLIPFELETIDFHEMFESIGYSSKLPVQNSQIWDRLVFLLSMGGLIVMPNNIRNARNEDNKIIFSLEDNTRFTVHYERKIDFDKLLSGKVDVYDWFDIKSGSKVQLDYINDKSNNIVNKILFYDSVRKGNGGKGRKDLVAVSRMKEKDLLDFDNSEGNIRLKTLKMMKDTGLRGKPNGYNKFGKHVFYAINIEHTHREINSRYRPKYTIQEIFKLKKNEKEIWKLTKKLLHHKQTSTLRESSR